MGTDWVRLFDKRLCEEIVALDSAALMIFASSRLGELKQNSAFRVDLGRTFPFPTESSISSHPACQ